MKMGYGVYDKGKNKYEGYWVADKHEGWGIQHFADGSAYHGY